MIDDTTPEDSRQEQVTSETTPLIDRDSPKDGSESQNEPTWREAWRAHFETWKVVYACLAFGVFLNSEMILSNPSRLRMLEATVCRQYYATHDRTMINSKNEVPEMHCKLDPIQDELAFIRSWSISFECAVGAIAGLPWGVIADIVGRKTVLFTSMIGFILSDVWYLAICYFDNIFFPRLTWTSCLFGLFGGGAITGVIMGICADATPPDSRSTMLFNVQACMGIVMVVVTPLGALALNNLGYWKAYMFSGVMYLVSLICLWKMPTTAKATHRHVVGGEEEVADVTGESRPSSAKSSAKHVDDDDDSNPIGRMSHKLKSWLSSLREALALTFTSPYVSFGMIIYTLLRTGDPLAIIISQYASKRYDWTISQASYINTVRAATVTCVLLLVLPAIQRLVRSKTNIHGPALDLRLLQASIPIEVLGFFLLGWAHTPVVFILANVLFSLGAGARGSSESYISSMVRPDKMATLYVIFNMISNVTMLVTSPVIAAAFSKGLHMGGLWMGLPFIGAGFLYALASIMATFLTVPKAQSAA